MRGEVGARIAEEGEAAKKRVVAVASGRYARLSRGVVCLREAAKR